MPFIPVPSTVQAELVYTWAGETCENVLHFESGGAPAVDNMVELGSHLIAWWNTNLKQYMNVSGSLVNVKLTDLNSAFAPAIDVVDGLPIIGTAAGDSLPNNCSCVFSKRTIFRGRSYRGRVYQVGLSEQHVTGNSVLTAPRNAILAAWELLMSFSTASESWQMVVVSRFEDNLPRTTGLTTPVIAFTTDGVIDSQRRRLPGRGT